MHERELNFVDMHLQLHAINRSTRENSQTRIKFRKVRLIIDAAFLLRKIRSRTAQRARGRPESRCLANPSGSTPAPTRRRRGGGVECFCGDFNICILAIFCIYMYIRAHICMYIKIYVYTCIYKHVYRSDETLL